jgi:Kef-type K+ transport system membrane component KefB
VKQIQKTAKLYLLVVGLAGLGLLLILYLGSHLPVPHLSLHALSESQPTPLGVSSHATSLGLSVQHRLLDYAQDPLSRFFLQIFVVIVVSNLVGWIFTQCGQPSVVGEMIAGVLLGPSLFGLLAPETFAFVFGPSSLEPLRLLSQVGVCLFMFAVGMEMDWAELRQRASAAVLISHAGIAVPSLLAAGLALVLYPRLAPPGAPFVAFALFVAVSMSITAFPVLVRILQDHGIFATSLGRTAAACAAVGDVTAWGLLAFVVAVAKSSDFGSAAICLSLVLVFAGIMFGLVRPNLARWLGRAAVDNPIPSRGLLATVIALVLASALCTQLLGIHALFGSFVAGMVMPRRGDFRGKLAVRIESISSVFLLPIFFASSGLRTEVGLLTSGIDWLICGAIIAIATIGKLGGSVLAARLVQVPWRESLQLGALMNTRGLMELIALNLGYELHILSQRLFSMLVLMALATTIMTGPLLILFGQRRRSTALSSAGAGSFE